jgi:biopolymer transport protein ExbB
MKLKLRLPIITSLFLGLATASMFAQAAAAAPASTHHDKTMMDLFIEGGWVMYPITLCSVAMIWFIVDGFLKTSTGKLYPADHVKELRVLFKKGDYAVSYTHLTLPTSP